MTKEIIMTDIHNHHFGEDGKCAFCELTWDKPNNTEGDSLMGDGLEEILANLVWEFSLIRNGMELGQHSAKEAGELERLELKAAKANVEALLATHQQQARIDELERVFKKPLTLTSYQDGWTGKHVLPNMKHYAHIPYEENMERIATLKEAATPNSRGSSKGKKG